MSLGQATQQQKLQSSHRFGASKADCPTGLPIRVSVVFSQTPVSSFSPSKDKSHELECRPSGCYLRGLSRGLQGSRIIRGQADRQAGQLTGHGCFPDEHPGNLDAGMAEHVRHMMMRNLGVTFKETMHYLCMHIAY